MPKLPALKAAEIVRMLERAGFVRVRQTGSHLRLRRGNLAVTLPLHGGDVPEMVVRSILRQAHLTADEFLALR
jgi:predicted RNA binding protein YcfA (HicA-like mRNA interferase family)